ncbi:MAG: PAS domain S-box protein [Dehalococcoidia bacterium]
MNGEGQRGLLEALGVAVYTTDADGRITLFNEAAAALWGRRPELGKDEWCGSWRIYYPDGTPMGLDECPMAVTLKEGRPVRDVEIIVERPDGSRATIVPYPTPLRDASGALVGAVNVLVDVTEAKRAQQRLQAQYSVSRLLAEAATLQEAAGKLLQALCESLDWDVGCIWMFEPEVDALTLREIWHRPDFDAVAFVDASRNASFTRGATLPGRIWSRGEPYWIADVASDSDFLRGPVAMRVGLRSGFGFPIRLGTETLGVAEVFSREARYSDDALLDAMASLGSQFGQFIERKRVEDELRESESRHRQLIEGLCVPVYTTDAGGRITLYNDAAAEFWGRRPELGKDEWCGSLRLFSPDGQPMPHDQCPMAIALKENRPVRGTEAIMERPDGRRVHFVPYPTPLHDASGALVGGVNVLIDITERKRADEELRESEERMRLAMVAGGMGTWDWNVLTGEVRWSESLEALHGLVPGTFAGTFEAFRADIHPEDREPLQASIKNALDTGSYEIEYRIIRPDGDVRWIAARGTALYQAGQPARMRGVCMDVTERKRAADRQRFLAEAGAVLASSLDYDTVLERIADLIVGSIADWSAIDMLQDDETVARVVVAHSDPAKREIATQFERYVYNPNQLRGVMELLRQGKALLFSELSEEQLAGAALDENHFRIMRDLGFRSVMVVPLIARWKLLGAITLVCAESGRHYTNDDLILAEDLARRAALAVDNARLYGESQRVQEELLKANEAKDEFLGLISHELRTPITTIYGGARVLRSRGDRLEPESRDEIVRDIESETERLHRIVENLLVLARVELGERIDSEPVLLQRLVDKVTQSFTERNATRPLECRVDAQLRPVAGEAMYLEQVLRNLLSNAEKYSPQGLAIELHVESCGDEAVVRVLDQGAGIEPEEAESIFERFYRSQSARAKARGLGLGLTVCKRLIEAQSGRVWARPREAGGLEVGFALPYYEDEVES